MGVIKGSFQKHLKTGGGQRQKLFVGERVLKVSLPLPPPPENFNHTLRDWLNGVIEIKKS